MYALDLIEGPLDLGGAPQVDAQDLGPVRPRVPRALDAPLSALKGPHDLPAKQARRARHQCRLLGHRGFVGCGVFGSVRFVVRCCKQLSYSYFETNIFLAFHSETGLSYRPSLGIYSFGLTT